MLLCRYDQECSGKSTGDQTTIEFEHWVEDALIMLGTHNNTIIYFRALVSSLEVFAFAKTFKTFLFATQFQKYEDAENN
jgi:hypothetical protein